MEKPKANGLPLNLNDPLTWIICGPTFSEAKRLGANLSPEMLAMAENYDKPELREFRLQNYADTMPARGERKP